MDKFNAARREPGTRRSRRHTHAHAAKCPPSRSPPASPSRPASRKPRARVATSPSPPSAHPRRSFDRNREPPSSRKPTRRARCLDAPSPPAARRPTSPSDPPVRVRRATPEAPAVVTKDVKRGLTLAAGVTSASERKHRRQPRDSPSLLLLLRVQLGPLLRARARVVAALRLLSDRAPDPEQNLMRRGQPLEVRLGGVAEVRRVLVRVRAHRGSPVAHVHRALPRLGVEFKGVSWL